ncbi:MarR family winged helix-turn-helix transcriptional regulator [Streptomyces sp. NPDC002574]|uniref:MarR family winged helix-turn-helix transcriptional regulator n=1 Tax=Streptomyces sp. NPDC002574 TaxID=3364652 RepID=UPI0036A8035C
MGSSSTSEAKTAAELVKAMTRLRARLRAESALGEARWSWSQLTTLSRIVDEGPIMVKALAAAEHVRRQSMAETVSALRAGGLVTSSEDPADRRRTLISATAEGRRLIETIPAAREAWLEEALRTLVRANERKTLLKAAALMSRIADSDR